MRKHAIFALWLCPVVLLGGVSLALADQTQTSGQQTATRQAQQTGKQEAGQNIQAARPPAIPPGMRLLSLKEGRAIVQGIAWADDEEGLAPDCSHLVHTLFQQAGYPYPYASSLDLYRGTGQFVRVRTPQPGDLIVWRGHVGIVVNPKEHSFFSSVTSGAHIENYRSAYWRARGYARFYRYLTKSPLKASGGASEAMNRPPEPQSKTSADRSGASDRTSTRQGERANDRRSLQAVKTAPAKVDTAPTDAALANTTPAAANSAQIPLRTAGKQPKAADVTSALEAANLDAGEILRAADLEQLERPVVVYQDLHVSGVEVKGKRGTAQVQLETLATLSAQRMESQKGWEDHTLELQHTKKGWVMTTANQNLYVPRDRALRILAARLAALTQGTERSTGKDREQADIIRFLNLLVE